jgi:lysophospholipase L1-like esterase
VLLFWALVFAARCGGSPNKPSSQPLPPSVTCPADVMAVSGDGGPVPVTFPAPAVQNGTSPVTTTCTPASNSSFAPGATSVRCLATDADSRTSACAFTVTVTKAAPPPQLSVTQFVAFGDSITEGKISTSSFRLLDDLPGSYPSRLRDMLPARYTQQQFVVTNEGRGGETASDGKSRLPGVLSADRPQVLLLLEGANDLFGGDQSKVSVVVSSLQSMIQTAKGQGVKVLIGTLTPERAGANNGGDALVVPTNDQIRQMASQQGATLVDLYAALSGDVNGLIGPDGLHPTSSGYELIAETFFAAIQQQFETTPKPSIKVIYRVH